MGKTGCDAEGALALKFAGRYQKEAEAVISSPARIELAGNHTDHQGGCVLAAAVGLFMRGAAARREDGVVNLYSEGFGEARLDFSSTEMRPQEKNTSAALIRGIGEGLKRRGYAFGGFDAYVTSDIPVGSGLSSSAAFELLMLGILSHLYNGGRVDKTEGALICQFAENDYFLKPSGLMDQMAVSLGGISSMDFSGEPKAERLFYDFKAKGYDILVTATSSHADLTAEYAAITAEMESVAGYFGKRTLSECSEEAFYAALPEIRKRAGDRAALRSLHFFSENKRPRAMAEALKKDDLPEFLRLMGESGDSSFKYLQNVYQGERPAFQPLSLVLALSEGYLREEGAVRVHGGGFGGTILALVPEDKTEGYRALMESVFGGGACRLLYITHRGMERTR